MRAVNVRDHAKADEPGPSELVRSYPRLLKSSDFGRFSMSATDRSGHSASTPVVCRGGLLVDPSDAVIHREFNRLRGVLEAVDLFPFEGEIAVDQIVGEHVALLEESGGEAARLFQDDDWSSSKLLVQLPVDVMTLGTFIGAEGPKLKPGIRENIARVLAQEGLVASP